MLRNKDVSTMLYPNISEKLEKQLKYANKKTIPYVVIIGPEEAKKNTAKLKNMKTGEQKELELDGLVKEINRV